MDQTTLLCFVMKSSMYQKRKPILHRGRFSIFQIERHLTSLPFLSVVHSVLFYLYFRLCTVILIGVIHLDLFILGSFSCICLFSLHPIKYSFSFYFLNSLFAFNFQFVMYLSICNAMHCFYRALLFFFLKSILYCRDKTNIYFGCCPNSLPSNSRCKYRTSQCNQRH